MIVQRQSILTGKVNEMDLPVSLKELHRWLYGRELVQRVFPNLTATQREFLISGMSEEEQNQFYGKISSTRKNQGNV